MAYIIGTREAKETAIDLVNVVLGLCLVFAPWALGFTSEMAATRNAWIVGAAIALIALGALFAFREWEEWVNLALGVWQSCALVARLRYSGSCLVCARHYWLDRRCAGSSRSVDDPQPPRLTSVTRT